MSPYRASAPLTRDWQHFAFTVEGGVATIAFNRPDKLNAITFEVYADLRDLVTELPQRGDVRVLVITGEGRGFSSGGDVEEIIGPLTRMRTDQLLEFTRMTGSVVQAMRECPLPIIAAINGIAAGAGSVIALASDLRLMAESASFAFLFTRVGLAGADMGSAYLLPRIVGLGRATELLLLGDKVPARRAYEIGLATAVVDDDALAESVAELAEPARQRSGIRLCDDQIAADPRARRVARRRDRAGGGDAGAADAFRGLQRVLRGLGRRSPTRLERTMNEPINPPTLAAAGRVLTRGPRRPDRLPGRVRRRSGPTARSSGETIVEQFEVAASNLIAALEGAGGVAADLVTLQVFVTDVSEYKGSLARVGRRLAPALRTALPGDGAVWRDRAVRRRGEGRADGRRGAQRRRMSSSAALELHLDDAQRALYRDTQRLAVDVLKPLADAEPPGRVNRPLIAALAEHGLLARLFGRGAEDQVSAIDLCLIREALARGCTEAETAFALQGLGAYPIVQAGGPELRERWLPSVAAGTAVAAFALTEPDAGSDPAALNLRAEPDGDGGYVLHGDKLWISNAPDADVYTVFARSDPDARGARGLTAFAIPGDAEGLSGERLELLAPHAIGSLRFDGVHAAPEQILGEPGAGFRVAMRTLDLFRPSVGAFAIGMARAALDLTIAYTSTRTTFGRPLRGASGDRPPARRAARADRSGPAARAPGGAGARPRRRRSRAWRRCRSCWRPRSPSRWSTRPSSSTAPSRCSAVIRSSTSTAMSARRGSTRARPRSSVRSSRGGCTPNSRSGA